MSNINCIFEQLERFLKIDTNTEFMVAVFEEIFKSKKNCNESDIFEVLKSFLNNIIIEIDKLGTIIKNNDGVLISVKNQKMLRTCYQIIISFGISPGLLPGLGINLMKRCASAKSLPTISLTDEQKYELLVLCTDFLTRSYDVPVLKNIVLTFHLSDYLAALIQLSFAPLKKPGNYTKFTMTEELYCKLMVERQKYTQIYEYLVNNCFQPILMKELLVLQNVIDHPPPIFVNKVIAKEMSKRLTAPGGLLSLIRCFIENHEVDVGIEWKKITMICKIISCKHGSMSEEEYINNIVTQLRHIMTLNNAQYLVTASSCLITLYEKYSNYKTVINLVDEIFGAFNYEALLSNSNLPGTIILTSQEIEHAIQILHACTSITQLDLPPTVITTNLYILYLLRLNSSKSELKLKLSNIIVKILDLINKPDLLTVVEHLIFGRKNVNLCNILVTEYESGLAIKCVTEVEYPSEKAVTQFIEIFDSIPNNLLVNNLFESCLQIFVDTNSERQSHDKETFLSLEDEPELLNTEDKKYAHMLHILSEISASQKVITALKANPLIVLDFVESLLHKNIEMVDECKTIVLVLLNTILTNVRKSDNLQTRLYSLIPKLNKISDDNSYINNLRKETISLIASEYPVGKDYESDYEKAVANVYDNLLPVRVHGIIELTKLIDKSDLETISKRHYIFCLFQDQLKHPDSYMYLAAINGISALAMHCTSEALDVLSQEYLDLTLKDRIETKDSENKIAELRMKIGDIIVKVTRRLGEMAVVHKTTLLNTMLCACKDDDPLIRTSALSNLAEIALVLNYKIGTILYEILLCIGSIIERDEALECRRAAVMVISSLIKGLGKETLVELNDTLLPIYRTLSALYKDNKEDSTIRLHAQTALEELNDIVKEFLKSSLQIDKEISLTKPPNEIVFK